MKAIMSLFVLLSFQGCNTYEKSSKEMATQKLTPEEKKVIIDKGTEAPYSGQYYNFNKKGEYHCKQCGAVLYRSDNKFDAGCGWPSFDDEVPGAVKRTIDADGIRTEISCANCGAHLGHVFEGEGLTDKNIRHCVNSISLVFVPDTNGAVKDTAIFASGCFWGTQFYLDKQEGVISTTVGYTGGHTDHPTYQQVCQGNTGHLESVQVVYDTTKISYKKLCEYFFETHDFTQTDGQGPDIGQQYHSAIFYRNDREKNTAEKVIGELTSKGYKVATILKPATTFWPAEDYHQEYYEHKGTTPYCHVYRKIF